MKVLISIFCFSILFSVYSWSQDLDQCMNFSSTPYYARRGVAAPSVTKLRDKALIVEYNSVFDVHPVSDTIKYPNIRIQPAQFDNNRILSDIQSFVKPELFDFVLIYTLKEVAGWIHSGGRLLDAAKNIGFTNSQIGIYKGPVAWKRLRAVPHMNDVLFLDRPTSALPHYGSSLTAFHEIGHNWIQYIAANFTIGPREWTPNKPIAYLAGCCAHWSYAFIPDKNGNNWPGIMYSGPTSKLFNAFDLYIMGLMKYTEAKTYSYTLQEDNQPTRRHEIRLDSLIAALKLGGLPIYESPGTRIPDLDPNMERINVLTIVVKGADEIMSQKDSNLVINLVNIMPEDWKIATWGRSTLASNLKADNFNQTNTTTNKDLAPAPFNAFYSAQEKSIKITRLDQTSSNINFSFSLIGLDGRVHRRTRWNGLDESINVSTLPIGIYVFTMVNGLNQVYSKKILIH